MIDRARPWLLLASLAAATSSIAACGDSDSPTSPTPAPDVAVEPTVNEAFTGTLGVNGGAFYSFEVTDYGYVRLTLQNIGGVTGVPESVWVGLGVGVPDGTDCNTTTSLNTQAGAGPHVTATLDEGIYCARIYDVGNLAATTPFTVDIAHP